MILNRCVSEAGRLSNLFFHLQFQATLRWEARPGSRASRNQDLEMTHFHASRVARRACAHAAQRQRRRAGCPAVYVAGEIAIHLGPDQESGAIQNYCRNFLEQQ